MAGGPSHLETFDPKPKLGEMNGQPMPPSFTAGKQIAQLQGQKLLCFAPQYGFKKFGRSGTDVCELFPQIGSVMDEIFFICSMTTGSDQPRSFVLSPPTPPPLRDDRAWEQDDLRAGVRNLRTCRDL